MRDSNSRHPRCKRGALPTELIALRVLQIVSAASVAVMYWYRKKTARAFVKFFCFFLFLSQLVAGRGVRRGGETRVRVRTDNDCLPVQSRALSAGMAKPECSFQRRFSEEALMEIRSWASKPHLWTSFCGGEFISIKAKSRKSRRNGAFRKSKCTSLFFCRETCLTLKHERLS